jgi:hypothetical protein
VAPGRTLHQQLVVFAILVVVMIVPIAIGVPAVAVFIPPFVEPAPASLPDLMQTVARTVRLLAVLAMMFNGFVELVIGLGRAMLAIVAIGKTAWSCSSKQESAQCGRSQERSPEQPHVSRQKSLHYVFPSLSAQG